MKRNQYEARMVYTLHRFSHPNRVDCNQGLMFMIRQGDASHDEDHPWRNDPKLDEVIWESIGNCEKAFWRLYSPQSYFREEMSKANGWGMDDDPRIGDASNYGVDLDPRAEIELAARPVEGIEEVHIAPGKQLKIRTNLPVDLKKMMSNFLKDNKDVFAWAHEDVVGIDSRVTSHHLNVDLNHPTKRKKPRPMNTKQAEALKEEANKLIQNSFIR